jgi:hypothetical protein
LAARGRALDARAVFARLLLRAVEPARRAVEVLRATGWPTDFAPVCALWGDVVFAVGIVRVLLLLPRYYEGTGTDLVFALRLDADVSSEHLFVTRSGKIVTARSYHGGKPS